MKDVDATTDKEDKDETSDMKDVDEDKPVNKDFIIKDIFMVSRLTRLFPHLFINSACDWTHPRARKITQDEAMKRILYNFEGT